MSKPKSVTIELLRLEALLEAAENNPSKQYNPHGNLGCVNPRHFDFEAYLAQNIVTELRSMGFARDVSLYQRRIDAVYQTCSQYRPPTMRAGW